MAGAGLRGCDAYVARRIQLTNCESVQSPLSAGFVDYANLDRYLGLSINTFHL